MYIFAKDLAQTTIPTVTFKHTAKEAIKLMEDAELHQMALVNNNISEGIVYLEDLKQEEDFQDYGLTIHQIREQKVGINAKLHVYDVFKTMSNNDLEILPVMDDKYEYLGCARWDQVLDAVNELSGIQLPGSIIVLRRLVLDYSMSEIARICENNDCKVVSSGVALEDEGHGLIITLKIDQSEVGGLINAFERYGYEIVVTFGDIPYNDHLKDRYDHLMNYLDL